MNLTIEDLRSRAVAIREEAKLDEERKAQEAKEETEKFLKVLLQEISISANKIQIVNENPCVWISPLKTKFPYANYEIAYKMLREKGFQYRVEQKHAALCDDCVNADGCVELLHITNMWSS